MQKESGNKNEIEREWNEMKSTERWKGENNVMLNVGGLILFLLLPLRDLNS